MKSGLRNSCSISERIENLELIILFNFLLLDKVNEIADIVDIVAKKEASTEGYDDNEKCLDVISWVQVSKTDGQDDGGSEIVAPDILLPPRCLNYAAIHHPAFLWTNIGNSNKDTCE